MLNVRWFPKDGLMCSCVGHVLYPSMSSEILVDIIEKLTQDEMRHTTQRMCLASSNAQCSMSKVRASSRVKFVENNRTRNMCTCVCQFENLGHL